LKSIVLIVATLLLPAAAQSEPVSSDQIRVIDGDTIRIFQMQPNVRLVGFNAPETRLAQCSKERELGDRAARRVRDLVRTEPLDFTYVDCSCPPGTEETMACNWGRSCGVLKIRGKDLGDILIGEGLAVVFKCGATRCPKTPKPWCTVE
jgi:endonuclease YncB( thermonuclease family)